MTIKNAIGVLKRATKIALCYNGNIIQFEKDDPLMVDAYGKYVVDEIYGVDENSYEISIAMQPMKEGTV